MLYHVGSCAAGNCVIARNPKSGAVLWTSPAIGSIKWGSPILVNGAIYMMNCNGACRNSGSSTLYKFALPAPTDIIFANGFDG